MSAREHYELAKQLKPLRDENILILSSGNVVHNLRTIHWQDNAQPYPWAKDFNEFFATQMNAKHHDPLIEWEKYGEAAHLSIPTPEHYWPALYTLALQHENERASIFVDGIEMSSISMLGFSVQ
jgi:4,5-DOPA dioxygenase extradiol